MNSSDLAGSFSWQSASLPGSEAMIERALAPRQLARLARGLAGGGGLHHLADDDLGLGGMFLEPRRQRLVQDVLDHRAHFRGHQLVLGLRGEFRIGHFHRQHRGQALAAVVAGQRDLFALGDGLGIAVDLARQRAAEARQMGAAVALRNVVGEAQHVLVVAVVPPQRRLDADAVHFGIDHDRRGHDRLLVAVEIFDELLDTAVVVHLLALLDRVAHVGQHDIDAGIQEGELAQAMFEGGEVVFDIGEGFRGGEERHLGAALAMGVADHLERRHRVAMGEFDEMLLAVAPDPQLQLARQRVDDGDADAVQAAGHLVGILVEFSARMQLGHDDLGRGNALALVNVDRNAAAVVAHRDRAVGVEYDLDGGGVAGERFVDGVVDDLVDHVMQAGAVIGVADIHARPLAHGIEAFQNPDRFRAVFDRNGMLSVGDRLPGRFCHVRPSRMSSNQRRKTGAESVYFCHERRHAPSAKSPLASY